MSIQSRFFTIFCVAASCLARNLQDGEMHCSSGFIMDFECIELGVLLDNQDVVTLQNPELHSIHCLVDIGICVDSGYTVLAPSTTGDGFEIDVQLDSVGNDMVVNAARTAGSTGGSPPCTTCFGGGTQQAGFAATVVGVLDDSMDPPLLMVTDVLSADIPCSEALSTPAPVSDPTDSPVAPTDAPVAPTDAPVAPTDAPIAATDAPVAPTDAPIAATDAPVTPMTSAPVSDPTDSPVTPMTMAPAEDPPETDAPVTPMTMAPAEPETDAPVTPMTMAPATDPPKTAAPVTVAPTDMPVPDPQPTSASPVTVAPAPMPTPGSSHASQPYSFVEQTTLLVLAMVIGCVTLLHY